MSAPATDNVDDSVLPDWAIAVIVIGLGSFAFVLVFGITVVCIEIKKATCEIAKRFQKRIEMEKKTRPPPPFGTLSNRESLDRNDVCQQRQKIGRSGLSTLKYQLPYDH